MNANKVISLLSLLYGYYYHLNKDTGKHEMKHHKWSYTGKTGPEHWVQNYPKCGGRLQSPIDIMTSEVEPVTWLTPLEFLGFDRISGHGSKSFLRLHNNGDTASIEVKDKMYILGSNLRDRYRAAEIHFHWGEDYRTGAEHSINHHHYPLEVHFVHYNDRYGNLSEATKHKDGLVVIGVFADLSREKNMAFEHVSEALYKVTEYDTKTDLAGIRPMDLLPTNTHNYFHYEGSLTTPPCYESVLWFVMEDIIYVSEGQIERFRHLKQHVDEKHGPHSPSNTTDKKVPGTKHKKPAKYIKHNFRPIQSLNGRPVYCSNPAMRSNTSRMSSRATSKTVLSLTSGNDPKALELLTHLPLTDVSGQKTSSRGTTDKTKNVDLSSLGIDITNLKQIGSIVPADKILSLGVTQNQIPQVSNMIFPHTNTGQISSKIGGSKTTSRLSIDFVNTNTMSANDKIGKTIKAVGTDSPAGLNGFDKRNEVKVEHAEPFTKGNVMGTPSKSAGRSDSLQKQTAFTSMSNVSGTRSKHQNHNSRIRTTKKESNTTKRAKILKFFANMFLKQAEILKRMQEQKVAQAAAVAATSRQNPDYGHSTKIFSNPPFGLTRMIETGNSGFDNNQLFNRRGIGFVHPEFWNVIPVSIETPSWKNPPKTAFAQDPKHFIQRQHLAYYDLFDRPIDQRSIIPYPGTKYNVIDPIPYGSIHAASTKPINLPSTSKLEKSIASRKSKLKRKGFRRKKSHKNKTERRKWLVDVITDYVKLIKVLTKH